MEKKQIVIDLPPDKHKAFKLATVEAETSMRSVLLNCIETYLHQQQPPTRPQDEGQAG
jgi:hypothetical protein